MPRRAAVTTLPQQQEKDQGHEKPVRQIGILPPLRPEVKAERQRLESDQANVKPCQRPRSIQLVRRAAAVTGLRRGGGRGGGGHEGVGSLTARAGGESPYWSYRA